VNSSSPTWPPIHRRLTLPGFRIGHAGDGATGVTVILCPEGARAAAEVFGSATGTRQFDSLVLPHHVATRAHGFVLSGGSAFGLDAAEPVSRWLVENGHGFTTGLGPVPLVPTAILFDGAVAGAGRPEERGRHARLAAEALEEALATEGERVVPVGRVGAGSGASVGKATGIERAMYGGFGFAASTLPGGPTVAAAVAVNAFGDVRDLAGNPVAGARRSADSRELDPSPHLLAPPPPEAPHPWEGNTTLAVVLTDAALSKPALHKVCRMAFGGLFRTLSPALSLYDGDLVAALSLGDSSTENEPTHVHQVAVLAERLVAEAILTGVRAANPPDVPLTPPRLP
jgi:L-aminopeptidase/D-esterase-like protein